MAPLFVSCEEWSIRDKWMLVPTKGIRYVALKEGRGLTCRSTGNIRVVGLDDASAKTIKEVEKATTNDLCTAQAMTTEQACRASMGFAVPTMVTLRRWLQRPEDALFAVIGGTAGPGTVTAYAGGKPVVSLSVTVAKTIRVPTAFHFVRHLPRGSKSFVRHSNTLSEYAIRTTLSLANGILLQGAVRFDVHSFGDVDVPTDLGPTVDCRSDKNAPVLMILATRKAAVPVNVFGVARVINNENSGGVTIKDRDIIIDNRGDAFEFSRTLAHELGHTLELEHMVPPWDRRYDPEKAEKVYDPKNLMGQENEQGLTKTQIGNMRTRAAKLTSGR